jgi:hypothetical protein
MDANVIVQNHKKVTRRLQGFGPAGMGWYFPQIPQLLAQIQTEAARAAEKRKTMDQKKATTEPGQPRASSAAAAAVEAVIRFVKTAEARPSGQGGLDQTAEEELGTLIASAYALCQSKSLTVPDFAFPQPEHFRPYGFLRIPHYRSSAGLNLYADPNWLQAMKELQVAAELQEAQRRKQPTKGRGEGATGRRQAVAGAGQETGKRRGKGKGGKRPLEESNPLKFQVYERINRERQPGEDHADIVQRLKSDQGFVGQVRDAKLTLNTKLVRRAIALFDQRKRHEERKKQETDPA